MGKEREFIATVTSKGQVTIPIAIRDELGLSPQDKIVFRLGEDSKVEIERLPMSLEEAYGSVAPLGHPQDFAAIQQTAREERAEQWAKKLSK